MNKKIKLFTIFCLLLFSTGCSVKYDLTINEDSSINEDVIAEEQTDRMEARTKLKGEQAINYLYNMFAKDNDRYSLSSSDSNKTTEVTASATYENIDEYSSMFTSDVFDNINVTRDGDKVTLTASQRKSLGGYDSTSLIYDEIEVNISVPFDVVSENADSIRSNVYTWKIEKGKKLKNIKITYVDKSEKDKATISINNKKYNFKYEFIVLGSFITIILGIVIFVVINNKKNNVV